MNDDDKQPSYERLDDTGQERNRRSFFDWLRGKEESEEERLRKKLDDELKEAARQRAEQFEEERREEEAREVAETKKLKKRWRAKLVEKSKSLLEDVAMSGEEPTSGYDIAKLMVAERIVKLDAMLHDESLDLRRSEVKSLKINIDFMGLLSEKLDRPELEVPAEIEQLYQTITASVEETTGEVPPHIDETPPETAPISDTDAAYNAFAASIVHAIRRTLRPDESLQHEPEHTNPRTLSGTGTGLQASHVDIAAEKLLTVVQEAALSGEAIRKELSQVDKARHLADVVEKVAMHEEPPVRMSRPVSSGSTLAIPVSLPAEHEPPHGEKGFDLPPNKKIKYLSDLELFALAKTVEVGSGRLLSDIYAKGEIDREGLVKVLEKYNKGEDFRSELVLRRNAWRRHKEQSAEYLSAPATPQNAPASSQKPKTTERLASFGNRVASLTSFPATYSHLRDIGGKPTMKTSGEIGSKSQLAQEAKTRLTRQGQVAVLAASILLVVVIFFVVIELNTR